MNRLPKRPCLTLTCRNMAMPRGSRCEGCHRQHRAERYQHPAYRALPSPRGFRCALRLSIRCRRSADTWHHLNGDATDHRRSNLAPACLPCNAKEGRQRKRISSR
jgi:hypothetical protein